jgi:hypothetical protein
MPRERLRNDAVPNLRRSSVHVHARLCTDGFGDGIHAREKYRCGKGF